MSKDDYHVYFSLPYGIEGIVTDEEELILNQELEDLKFLTFKYRGYKGKIEFNEDTTMFDARLIDLPDNKTLEDTGNCNSLQAHEGFKLLVDDYIELNKRFQNE